METIQVVVATQHHATIDVTHPDRFCQCDGKAYDEQNGISHIGTEEDV